MGSAFHFFLLWFAVYNYREAGPIAEENLRGLALTLTVAIENLAVQDPSLADLAKFHTSDITYSHWSTATVPTVSTPIPI